jgi:hypothetical protein
MQIIRNGEFGGWIVHKYRIPNIKSKFSVWYDRCGFVLDMERIDRLGRSFPATAKQREYAFRWRPVSMIEQ